MHSWPRRAEPCASREGLVIRVYLAVSDSIRRSALNRLLRADPDVELVIREGEADVIVADAAPQRAELVAVEAGEPDLARPVAPGEHLTPREGEVLRLVAAGMGNARIGAQLGISKSTVKYHLGAIFTKLGVHTRAEAVTQGIRSGIVLV